MARIGSSLCPCHLLSRTGEKWGSSGMLQGNIPWIKTSFIQKWRNEQEWGSSGVFQEIIPWINSSGAHLGRWSLERELGALEFVGSIWSSGIFWLHPTLGGLSEGGGKVPKEKVWDLFEKSGKIEQPHSQDAPETLILSGSARQEFPDFFSMWEWIFRGVVISLSGQHQPPKSHQNFTCKEKNLEVQAEFLHFFGFWDLWNSLFSTLFFRWNKSSGIGRI